VSLTIGEGGLALDLPEGAEFPMDFASASGGLLRGGTVVPASAGRTRLELKSAGGWFDGMEVDAEQIVLRFRGRSAGTVTGPDDYRLGPEDRLQVSVARQPELTRELVVSQTGTVAAPLIGEIRAAGLTPGQLAARMADLLARDYIVDPQVDIAVLEYRSQWVVIGGEVREPKRVALRGGTDLKEALAEAGGLGPQAGTRIEISRRLADGSAAETIQVDRQAFERGNENPQLQHGDIVNVPRASWCYIDGEVRQPGRLPIEPGLTLLRAIALQGGTTEWANRKAVVLRREGEEGPGTVINLRDIEQGKIPDPVLKGGEVVLIKRRFL